jgi:hypothetical protein
MWKNIVRQKCLSHIKNELGLIEQRIERVEEACEMGRAAAQFDVKSQQTEKKLFVKDYFGRNIDDPEWHHLRVNADRIPYEDSARLIAETLLNWCKSKLAAKVA